jgi:hypothetical protein
MPQHSTRTRRSPRYSRNNYAALKARTNRRPCVCTVETQCMTMALPRTSPLTRSQRRMLLGSITQAKYFAASDFAPSPPLAMSDKTRLYNASLGLRFSACFRGSFRSLSYLRPSAVGPSLPIRVPSCPFAVELLYLYVRDPLHHRRKKIRKTPGLLVLFYLSHLRLLEFSTGYSAWSLCYYCLEPSLSESAFPGGSDRANTGSAYFVSFFATTGFSPSTLRHAQRLPVSSLSRCSGQAFHFSPFTLSLRFPFAPLRLCVRFCSGLLACIRGPFSRLFQISTNRLKAFPEVLRIPQHPTTS